MGKSACFIEKNEVDDFLSSLINQIDIINEQHQKLLAQKKLYDDCMVVKNGKFVCDRDNFVKMVFNLKYHDKLVNMLDDFLVYIDKDYKNEIQNVLREDKSYDKDYIIEGKGFLDFISTVIKNANNLFLSNDVLNKYKGILDNTINMLERRYKDIYNITIQHDLFGKNISEIKRKYNKDITKAREINITEEKEFYDLASSWFSEEVTDEKGNVKYVNINYGDDIKANVIAYNNYVSAYKIARKQAKKIVKIPLDDLEYEDFPLDENVDFLYPLLKCELEKQISKVSDAAHVLPILDFWYYIDRENISIKK